MHAELLIMYALHCFRNNSNSLRYWIYTLIITTYRMNKRGFDCALSRATSRAVFSPIFYFSISFFPLFFSSILPRLLAVFFSFFFFLSCTPSGFEPLTFRIHLAYQSFFYTTTPRDSVEVYPPKTNFYSTWLVGMSKNSHNNLLIHLFNTCCMLHACTKTSIAFVGPWRIESGGHGLFLSRNRLHLSCSSRFVFISYINTQCLR